MSSNFWWEILTVAYVAQTCTETFTLLWVTRPPRLQMGPFGTRNLIDYLGLCQIIRESRGV